MSPHPPSEPATLSGKLPPPDAAVRITLPDGRLVLSVDSDGLLRIGDIMPAEFAAAVRSAFTQAPHQDATIEQALTELRALGVNDPASWLLNAVCLAEASATPSQVRVAAGVISSGKLGRTAARILGIAEHIEDLRTDGSTDERIRVVRELYRMAADDDGPSAHTLARAALALSDRRTS